MEDGASGDKTIQGIDGQTGGKFHRTIIAKTPGPLHMGGRKGMLLQTAGSVIQRTEVENINILLTLRIFPDELIVGFQGMDLLGIFIQQLFLKCRASATSSASG